MNHNTPDNDLFYLMITIIIGCLWFGYGIGYFTVLIESDKKMIFDTLKQIRLVTALEGEKSKAKHAFIQLSSGKWTRVLRKSYNLKPGQAVRYNKKKNQFHAEKEWWQ